VLKTKMQDSQNTLQLTFIITQPASVIEPFKKSIKNLQSTELTWVRTWIPWQWNCETVAHSQVFH